MAVPVTIIFVYVLHCPCILRIHRKIGFLIEPSKMPCLSSSSSSSGALFHHQFSHLLEGALSEVMCLNLKTKFLACSSFSAEMSTRTVQFHESKGRRWVVGALVLAVMAVVCNQVGASRFYPPHRSHHSRPPPPSENFLRPPFSSQLQGHANYHSEEHLEGVHDPALHHERSLLPLLRKDMHQKEIYTHNKRPLTLPGRRLFGEECLGKEHSGIKNFPLGSGSLQISCAPQAGYAGHPPVGSPAPPPTSGSDDHSTLPALLLLPLPSLSSPANSNNNTQAHTTMESAMKVDLVN